MQIVSNNSLIAAQTQKTGPQSRAGGGYADVASDNGAAKKGLPQGGDVARRQVPVDKVDIDTKTAEKRFAEARSVRRKEAAVKTQTEQDERRGVEQHHREAPRASENRRSIPPGSQINIVV